MTFRGFAISIALLTVSACGGSSSSSNGLPPTSAGMALARFVEGAPELETIIDGVPQELSGAYLQVNGQTVASQFSYGTLTSFVLVTPGKQSLLALNSQGYRVGPFQSSALSGGKSYTLILVGNYPHYHVLTFAEPQNAKNTAQLSLYEASPSVPKADFGGFTASSHKNYKQLGSATLGVVATVSLGAHVTNFGAYAGKGTKPFICGTVVCGDVTPAQISSFDKHNQLPFNKITRLSLFLLDVPNASTSPVIGSLDR